uniref:NADH-ubiquinone oxidoreductase chain 5 n=1 Tax=Anthribidae sp. 6 ACP-2013 TaxID=1434433 RepID=A0A3G5FNA5_9CUCU|nr:NADH dehydrogenase subunit 5 [Anthribidae sp. 6 ACP-2013]
MFFSFSMMFLFFSIVLFFLGVNFVVSYFFFMFEYNLVYLNSLELNFSVFIDWMTLYFMSFVCLISSMVLLYSQDYMSEEKNKNRFILLVVLFVFSMMFMIMSPNLISILLGWDGLGLVSYCLVIYYQNVKSFNAGMLTALTNRIGDVALLMAIAWMMNFGSWNFLNYLEIMKFSSEMKIIGFLVILAAWTKSAQIPFSSWLPAAMAAPTPVSSLVHSSTLVTAGVYLLIRFNFMFTYEMKFLMLFLSLLTMFMSGLSASFEFDLKKIVALSTLSQLGLMMSILLLGDCKLAYYHLLTHAIFKALLFMCAGNFIHNFLNFQDIRYMGVVVNLMPLTSSFFNISNLSLCGIPFLSGFYSKDLILEFMSMNYLNMFVYLIFYISIGLTVMYSVRLSYYMLFGKFNFLSLNMISDSSLYMSMGMFGLISFVVISGSGMMWTVFSEPYYISLPPFMKMMTLLMIVGGGVIGYEYASLKMNFKILMLKFYKFSLFNALMWNMPMFSTLGMNFYFTFFGQYLIKILDQGWVEIYGPQQLSKNFSKLMMFFQFIFANHIKIYFILLVFWLVFFMMI